MKNYGADRMKTSVKIAIASIIAVIAAALLHDWVEDCNGDLSTLDISYDTRLAISLVTFDKKRYADQNIPKDKALAMHYDIIKREINRCEPWPAQGEKEKRRCV